MAGPFQSITRATQAGRDSIKIEGPRAVYAVLFQECGEDAELLPAYYPDVDQAEQAARAEARQRFPEAPEDALHDPDSFYYIADAIELKEAQ